MAIAGHARVHQFKSPIRMAAAFLLKSRETVKKQSRRLREELQARFDQQVQQSQQQLRQLNDAWRRGDSCSACRLDLLDLPNRI